MSASTRNPAVSRDGSASRPTANPSCEFRIEQDCGCIVTEHGTDDSQCTLKTQAAHFRQIAAASELHEMAEIAAAERLERWAP